jgi:dTDP-4-amino-4,6-dideoxygalactose transaminase
MRVPFNRPKFAARETEYVLSVLRSGKLRAGGDFTQKCQDLIASRLNNATVLITNSATSALDMSLILCDVGPEDEVIVPTFTFVSCGNSILSCGATPVFVDVEPDTLNIDLVSAASAITPRTKAIMPVHYAGSCYAVTGLRELADKHRIRIIEDASHAIASKVNGKEAGTFGETGAFSFHHSKNITCGEGGALIVNDDRLTDRAGVIHKYGTDYHAFRSGKKSHYEWTDRGSSFMASDLTAAVLLAQLERLDEISNERRATWNRYHDAFEVLERSGVTRPNYCTGSQHNGHIYYLLLPTAADRTAFIAAMASRGIEVTSHYVPLDLTPGGRKFGRSAGELPVAHSAAERLVRFPIWEGIGSLQDAVIEATLAELSF